MNTSTGANAFQIGISIVGRSWQLPWQEKFLFFYPALIALGIAAALVFANGLGIESYGFDIRQANPGAPIDEIKFELVEYQPLVYQIYTRLVFGFIILFFSAAAITTALRALGPPYQSMEDGLQTARGRLGQLLALTVIYSVLQIALGLLPTLFSLLGNILVGLLFVMVLPSVVADGEYWMERAIGFASRIRGVLLVSFIALAISVALPIFVFLLLMRDTQMDASFAILLLLAAAWILFPVGLSYQALIYDHAAGIERAEQAAAQEAARIARERRGGELWE